jgi:hypothetical protein
MSHQRSHPLQHSKILLKCLEYQPNDYRLVHFTANYLSSEYRIEFLNLISQTVTDNVDILKIIINEIQLNKQIHNEQFLDAIIDGLKENINDGIECILELIERMKKYSNKNWKNILRLKQKFIYKLANQDYSQIQTRILVAKLIVQTIIALRLSDRSDAINRLVHKSHHSLILHAYIFYDLLNLEQTIESEEFLNYLQQLLEHHSSESIVFDLLRVYNQSEKILELLQKKIEEENLPIQQTNQLLLILKLFPDSMNIAETIYKFLIEKSIKFFQSKKENNP